MTSPVSAEETIVRLAMILNAARVGPAGVPESALDDYPARMFENRTQAERHDWVTAARNVVHLLGLVAIDPALVAEISEAETTWYARECKVALADHVLAQLGGR